MGSARAWMFCLVLMGLLGNPHREQPSAALARTFSEIAP